MITLKKDRLMRMVLALSFCLFMLKPKAALLLFPFLRKNLCKRDIAYTTTEVTVLSTKQFIHKVVCCKMHVTTCQQYCRKGG